MREYPKLLDQILAIANQQFQVISHQQWEYKTLGKWSKKEILGHLIDSAYNNHQRFIRAENQENLIFLGYDQDEWVVGNQYQDRAVEEIIRLFFAVHTHLKYAISSLRKETLLKPVENHNFHQISMNKFPIKDAATLEFMVWDYLFHLEHHLAQIIENYTPVSRKWNI